MGALEQVENLEFAVTESENVVFKVRVSLSWDMLGLFIISGLTNQAKGPLVGAAVIITVVGAYLLFSRQWRRMSRYLWLWGWLIMAVIAVAWPWAVYRRYPEVWENWRFDYSD